jgi:hypothetical protein
MAINLKKENRNETTEHYENRVFIANEIEKDLNYSREMVRQKRIANKLAKIAKDIAIVSDIENITPDTICNTILTNFYDYREIERLKREMSEMMQHIQNKLLTIYSTIKQ